MKTSIAIVAQGVVSGLIMYQFQWKPFQSVSKLNYPDGIDQLEDEPATWVRHFDGQLRPFGSVGVDASNADYVLAIGKDNKPDVDVGWKQMWAYCFENGGGLSAEEDVLRLPVV